MFFISSPNIQKGESASERYLKTSPEDVISDNGSQLLPNNTDTTAPTSTQSFFFNNKIHVEFYFIIFFGVVWDFLFNQHV